MLSSQFITNKYIEQLRILEKAINHYNEGSSDAEYIVYDNITKTPDMQNQSDDTMKANSETAGENLVITHRISFFWNELLQREHLGNESEEKQAKNQFHCPDFIDLLKWFHLLTIPP